MKSFLNRRLSQTSPLRLAYHRMRAFAAALIYGFPARRLTVIGITGTDGKTTTVGITAHILNANGVKAGALSTAFFQIGREIRWNSTQKTSPSPFMIQKFLRELVRAGCTHAVIECSSHGLLQGRLKYTYPSIAGITNVSEEHLDYHGTMERYIDAKSILFRMLPKHAGVAILNASDRSFESLRTISVPWRIIVGSEEAIVRRSAGDDFALWPSGISATTKGISGKIECNAEEGPFPFDFPLFGTFNVQNALCAVACAHATGLGIDRCVRSLSSFTGIPGRLERMTSQQEFHAFVDFTVTPQSYRATLGTLKSMLQGSGRLLVLCGSCGDRMKEKRPVIGSLCASFAHITVVTNEDPYTEDPESIIDDVLLGVPSSVPVFRHEAEIPTAPTNPYVVRIPDRLSAIRFLLKQAKPNDILLFAGKGSDTTMMTSQGQIPWNEREIIRRELDLLSK